LDRRCGVGSNDLYLAVLPLVHVTLNHLLGFGLTEETLTLFPDKNFATEFTSEEVQKYIDIFDSRANKYLVGGRVINYEFFKEEVDDGRFIVRVKQNAR
jgi:hypothetical protein